MEISSRSNIENLRGNPSPGIVCFIRIFDFDYEQGIHLYTGPDMQKAY